MEITNNTYPEVPLEYMHENYAVIRLQPGEKAPISGEKVSTMEYKKCTRQEWLEHNGNWGVLCGSRSRNFEALDFDIKHWKHPRRDMMKEWKQLVAEQEGGIDLLKKLTVLKTPSGGYHMYYRCERYEGNLKLSRNEKGEAFIETRGDGGYVCTWPSPGYEWIQGDLEYPVISIDEREILIGSSLAMNEYADNEVIKRYDKKAKTRESSGHPFDDYNRNADAISLLEKHGWKRVRQGKGGWYLRRPGKDKGISAHMTFDFEVPIFICFTTSTIFDNLKGYNPAMIFTQLECDGDTDQAMHTLLDQGFGEDRRRKKTVYHEKHERNDVTEKNLGEEIQRIRITEETDIPDLPPIVTIKDRVALTEGNVMTLSGMSKVGKSGVINGIVSKSLNNEAEGWPDINVAGNPGGAIVHIDTEQSKKKQQNNLKTWILARLPEGTNTKHYYALNYRDYTYRQAKQNLGMMLQELSSYEQGIFLVIIDGISEFVKTVNDNEESQSVMKYLLELSSIYNCGILCVLHTNQMSGENNKLRGHLGSDLERKSETVLHIKKDIERDGVSLITPTLARNFEVDDFPEMGFHFSKEHMRHEQIDMDDDAQFVNKHLEKLKVIAEYVKGMTKAEAVYRLLEKDPKLKNSKAATLQVNECIRVGLLTESEGVLKKLSKI